MLTTNGTTNADYGGSFPNTGKLTPPTSALWLRTSFDGTNVITEYSYDGTTFTAHGSARPGDRSSATAGVTKIGLFVKHDGGGTPAAVKFDSFNVEAESCGCRRCVAAAYDPRARSGVAQTVTAVGMTPT